MSRTDYPKPFFEMISDNVVRITALSAIGATFLKSNPTDWPYVDEIAAGGCYALAAVTVIYCSYNFGQRVSHLKSAYLFIAGMANAVFLGSIAGIASKTAQNILSAASLN